MPAARPLSDEERFMVADQFRQTKSHYRRRDTLFKEIRKTRFLENQVRIPDPYKSIAVESKSPYPHEIVAKITAALSVNAPQIEFTPVMIGDAGVQNATIRKLWSEGARERMERDASRRHFRMFTDSQVCYGMGVMKSVFRPDAWIQYNRFLANLDIELDAKYGAMLSPADPNFRKRMREFDVRTEEFKRSVPFPIKSYDVEAKGFYRMLGEDGFTHDFEEQVVPYLSTLKEYGLGLGTTTVNGTMVDIISSRDLSRPEAEWGKVISGRRMHMVEHWTPEYIDFMLMLGDAGTGLDEAAIMGATIAKRIPNPYSQSPYFPSFGISTSDSEPAYEGVSVLFGVLHLFPLLDALLTVKSGAAFLSGFPPYKEKAGALSPGNIQGEGAFGNEGIEQTEQTAIEPGRIYPLDIEPVELPRSGPDLDNMIDRLVKMFEQVLPPITTGVGGTSDAAGYAVAQMIASARLAWDPIVDNSEFALASQVGFWWKIVETRIKERVYVEGPSDAQAAHVRDYFKSGWVSLAPPDIAAVYRTKVKLDPVLPQNKILELRYHVEMVNAGFETKAMAITAMGNNPDMVERGSLLEELKRDPSIRNRLRQVTLALVMSGAAKPSDLEAAAAGVLGDQSNTANNGTNGAATPALGKTGQPMVPGQNAPIQQPIQAPPTQAALGAGETRGIGVPSVPAGAPQGVPSSESL